MTGYNTFMYVSNVHYDLKQWICKKQCRIRLDVDPVGLGISIQMIISMPR